jgi:thymidylate synthase (FAD)
MKRIELLDHGYIELIESWGSDERIIEAARMSTGKGFNGWGSATCANCGAPWESTGAVPYPGTPRCPSGRGGGHTLAGEQGDEKLLRFLYENKHATPFEMAGLIVEVKAPIFVFREWHRHRTQSFNEMSARYTPLPNENYVPTVERLLVNSKTNKQAGTIAGADDLTEAKAEVFRKMIVAHYDQAEDIYQEALLAGVPKELARVHLPVGRYSRMRASANLRNWLAFLTLRMAPNAQWEIRQYANAIGSFIEKTFSRTWELFIGEQVKNG